jgi:biopolymer transport protein ExbD
VLISGEKGADLALALDVLDRLRLAGVPRVTFLTEEKKAGQ